MSAPFHPYLCGRNAAEWLINMKILVIEDEKLLADSIKTLLEGKGFEVEVAYDGETGAEYAELGIYDLLILSLIHI